MNWGFVLWKTTIQGFVIYESDISMCWKTATISQLQHVNVTDQFKEVGTWSFYFYNVISVSIRESLKIMYKQQFNIFPILMCFNCETTV